MMYNNLIDNSSDALSMQSYLKRCIKAEDINKIQIATGYWDLKGMAIVIDELSDFLAKPNSSMQLLIGKDPYVYASLLKNPKYKDRNYPYDFIRTDIHQLEVTEQYERVVELLLKHCESGKIKIRIYNKDADHKETFLHSKCYIFSGPNYSFGIIGSSNFTEKGLLGNAELNYLETDPARITASPREGSATKGHICWFEEKWDIAQEWTQEFLEQVLKKSPIVKKKPKKFTPYELYIKLLQIKFGDVVDKSFGQQIETYLPSKFHKLDYQIDAVKRCISIMHEHGGFILGDVVGLGKTVVGTLIVKHFLSVPQDDGRERKVLIITPPAIQSGWQKAVAMFDEEAEDKMAPCIDFITTGSIGHLLDDNEDDDLADTGDFEGNLQEKDYGLIIIDESHKFRNSDTRMYQSLDHLIQSIGTNTGEYPYIGLLSATPQNNRPNDLKNQIYLFQRNHNDSTLKKAEGGNLERFFADINKEYELLIRKSQVDKNTGLLIHDIPEQERRQRLDAISKKLRDCVLVDIMERRTRTDVERYYKKDKKAQELEFPKIVGPNNLKYVMDEELATLFSDTMTIIAPSEEEKKKTGEWLHYMRYRAIEYFVDNANEQKHTGRGNRGVGDIARQLATIMQTLLVKRLESSFSAFKQSLLNLRRYTENMIWMWENDTIFICPQIDVNKELDFEAKSKKRDKKVTFEDCVNDIRAKIDKLTKQGKNEKGQNAEYTHKDFKEEYYTLLKEDLRLIKSLYDRWASNSEDPKLNAFREKLKPVLFDPQKNTSGKLVIFSEAIDTVKVLARAVKNKGFKPLVITAANRDEKEHIIEQNFDANYEGEWRDDYNIIITTEVLAEGVNLHRANVILNYDTPWNSTRLMQRIGRVNRIGSKESFVYVYNFMPSAEGDAQIQLVRKAYTKLESFHVLFGGDNKILSEEESIVHYDIAKAVEGEESPLLQYISELKQYKTDHPMRYAQIEQANGKWEMALREYGTAYFLVKAPRSAKLAISITVDDEGQQQPHIVSLLDLLEAMRVDENAVQTALPKHWQELREDAILAYNQYFVRINRSRAGDKRTQALEVIVNLYNARNISDGSKKLLVDARRLVDKGSIDIIRKMLVIGNELKKKDPSLFAITQQDIDNLLHREIGKLIAHVQTKQGKPKILLGTIK